MNSICLPNDSLFRKTWEAVTFVKYLARAFSLIFLTKPLIWNKITFRLSNSLNLAELVANEQSKKIYQYSFFYPIYHCLL